MVLPCLPSLAVPPQVDAEAPPAPCPAGACPKCGQPQQLLSSVAKDELRLPCRLLSLPLPGRGSLQRLPGEGSFLLSPRWAEGAPVQWSWSQPCSRAPLPHSPAVKSSYGRGSELWVGAKELGAKELETKAGGGEKGAPASAPAGWKAATAAAAETGGGGAVASTVLPPCVAQGSAEGQGAWHLGSWAGLGSSSEKGPVGLLASGGDEWGAAPGGGACWSCSPGLSEPRIPNALPGSGPARASVWGDWSPHHVGMGYKEFCCSPKDTILGGLPWRGGGGRRGLWVALSEKIIPAPKMRTTPVLPPPHISTIL